MVAPPFKPRVASGGQRKSMTDESLTGSRFSATAGTQPRGHSVPFFRSP